MTANDDEIHSEGFRFPYDHLGGRAADDFYIAHEIQFTGRGAQFLGAESVEPLSYLVEHLLRRLRPQSTTALATVG